ncbi:myotrophin-like [Amphibalanus amphitrite]|uniref:myotrophin-like n=1 Tax=Amphibalanus amphitrite TaxID=1232801 RepID=UPI001C8FBEB8|nr:myotrophin-like [Amphibalanus amphitrite]
MSGLVWSIKNGDIEQVKEAVESKKVDLNAPIDGRSPIHYAADYGQLEVLKYLLSKGADLNVLDKHGISAILAAIWEGHTDCVKLMLEKGASKSGKTPDGTSYIDAAEKADIKALLR